MHGGDKWTIGEIAARHEISVRAVRFYEQRGLLAPAPCTDARRYDAGDNARLEMVLKAKRMGFSLSDIARIVDRLRVPPDDIDPNERARTAQRIARQIEVLSERYSEVQSAIDELTAVLRVRDRAKA